MDPLYRADVGVAEHPLGGNVSGKKWVHMRMAGWESRRGDTMRNVLLGITVAAVMVSVTPVIAQAQTITCAPGTMVLQRAVGSPNAPMFVPAQVHATVCSQNGTVIAVAPSFRTVGPSSAPMIVPVNNGVTTCVPTTVATVAMVGGELTAPLQLSQVGSSVVAVNNGATPGTPIVVTSPTVLTCF